MTDFWYKKSAEGTAANGPNRPNRNGSYGDHVMAKRQLPSPEVIRQLLDYDPSSGKLFWRERCAQWFSGREAVADGNATAWNTRRAGTEALTADSGDGYLAGTILRQRHYAHRIVWLHVHGEWPKQIDHINGNRSDNRISNLRAVDQKENMRNQMRRSDNKSGVVGVMRHGDRWRAYIRTGGRQTHLGYFDSFDSAVSARKSAERKHGFHKNHGRPGHGVRKEAQIRGQA